MVTSETAVLDPPCAPPERPYVTRLCAAPVLRPRHVEYRMPVTSRLQRMSGGRSPTRWRGQPFRRSRSVGGDREADLEAASGVVVGDADGAAVRLDDASGDRQTEPTALTICRCPRRAAAEGRREQPRQVLLRDAAACVRNSDADHA